MIIVAGIVALLTGLTRALVGAGKYVSRGWGYPLVATLAASAGPGRSALIDAHGLSVLDPWVVAIAVLYAVIPAVVLWRGIDGWERQSYMGRHYGIACLALALADIYVRHIGWALPWAAASYGVGYFYEPLLERFKDVHVRINSRLDIDANRIAEFIAGAVIIGGVAFLGGF